MMLPLGRLGGAVADLTLSVRFEQVPDLFVNSLRQVVEMAKSVPVLPAQYIRALDVAAFIGLRRHRRFREVLALFDPEADGDPWSAKANQGHVYLAVSDLEAVHARAERLGGLSPAMGNIETRPWGERSFYMTDPSGNPLCFVDGNTLFTGHQETSREVR